MEKRSKINKRLIGLVTISVVNNRCSEYITYPVICYSDKLKIKALLEFDHGAGFWFIRYCNGKLKDQIDTLSEALEAYHIHFV